MDKKGGMPRRIAIPLLIVLGLAAASCGTLSLDDDESEDPLATEVAGAVRATQVAVAVQATLAGGSPTVTPTLEPTASPTPTPSPTNTPTPEPTSTPTPEPAKEEVVADFQPSSLEDLLATEADLGEVYSPLKFLLSEEEVVAADAPQALDGFVDGRVLEYDVFNFELLESEFFAFDVECHQYGDSASAREWVYVGSYVSEDIAEEFIQAEPPQLGDASLAGTATLVGEEVTLYRTSVWFMVDHFACEYAAWGDVPPDVAKVVDVVETKLHLR